MFIYCLFIVYLIEKIFYNLILFLYSRGRIMAKLLKVNIQKELKEFDLDVDFELKKGCLGILGPSGCGKSMTLKSIAGIVNPDNGFISLNDTVYFDSINKTNLKPQKRNVGYLFQNYALFPNMTVEENVAIGLGKGYDKNHLSEIIKRYHLNGLEKRYPRELSGGQQQRVALARIMAYGPDVILLDEPFSAMDTFLKEQLRLELVNSLRDFDGFSIMVTHNRDEAFQFCDELIILDKGKVIAKGDTHEVFENPRKVQVARLTGCKNISRIEIIDDYHAGYDSLLAHIRENANDMPTIKADITELERSYFGLFVLDNYRLFFDLVQNAPKAIYVILTRDRLRDYWIGESANNEVATYITGELSCREILGDDLKIVKRNTQAMWDPIEKSDVVLMVLRINSGTFVKNAGEFSEKIDSTEINGKFRKFKGLEYQCNNESYELLYMEV